MAQTFREFITECELYEYSQEYYELMKESSELQLMDMYIRNQTFLKESAPEFESAGMTFTEGYFCEAAAEDKMTAIVEAFGQKKEGLFQKIKSIIKGLIDAMIRFFNKKKKAIQLKMQAAKLSKLTGGLITRQQAETAIKAAKAAGFIGLGAAAVGGVAVGAKFGIWQKLVQKVKKGLKFGEDVPAEEQEDLAKIIAAVNGDDITIELPEPLKILPTLVENVELFEISGNNIPSMTYNLDIAKINAIKETKVYTSTMSENAANKILSTLKFFNERLEEQMNKPEEVEKYGADNVAAIRKFMADLIKAEQIATAQRAAAARAINAATAEEPAASTEEKKPAEKSGEEQKATEKAPEDNKQ